MSDAQLVNIDPAIETPIPVQNDSDQQEHVRTFNSFVHVVLSFVLHAPLLLGGIYAMTLGGSVALGALMAVAGIAILILG
ncbi:hypothetical protein [Pelagibacterium luteolum]|uniref:Aa3 type cytochrome c oxidase subunit IV n=1 Tax=Pelagibacterium luteolum TaxID=440168 RepID=A0A1G7XHU0_9HYPH|nr:hypothetical protein [Pelagibacterium luteolum]SDG83661.1 hypothetical protein SAMN04487974_109120 [Pelagibacterium luteolum]